MTAQPRAPSPDAPPPESPVPPPPPQPVPGEVKVAYTETSRIRVRGEATGRVYEFSAVQATQVVEGRDATALLESRFFRRLV